VTGALSPLLKLGGSLTSSRSLDARDVRWAAYIASLLMGGKDMDRRTSATRAMVSPPPHNFVTLSMDSNNDGMSGKIRDVLRPVVMSFNWISYLHKSCTVRRITAEVTG
jgi:hypothetical protein